MTRLMGTDDIAGRHVEVRNGRISSYQSEQPTVQIRVGSRDGELP